MELNKICHGDWIDYLKSIDDNIINCCVTSPPYFGLRDYGEKGQVGLEKSPEEYIEKLVIGFREVKRCLRKDGTLWLNIGDSYCSTAPNSNGDKLNQRGILSGITNRRAEANRKFRHKTPKGCKPKDLIGIPWMLAFALRADGWYLRQDIIWHKPNPMPESVTDRCTKSHEYIFLLSKSAKYYYDNKAIAPPIKDASILRLAQNVEAQNRSARVPGKTNGNMKAVGHAIGGKKHIGQMFGETKSGKAWQPRPNGIVRDRLLDYNSKEKIIHPNTPRGGFEKESDLPSPELTANKKSVWTVSTKPFSEAHFATFPEELINDCILAGCPENGIVLDPFMGAGTTAIVAMKHNRNFVGCELNPEYIKIANKRISSRIDIFNQDKF